MFGISVTLIYLCYAQGKRMKRMASDKETCPSKNSMISNLMFPAGSFVISLSAHQFLSSAPTWSHCHTHQSLAQGSGTPGTVPCGASLCKGASCLISDFHYWESFAFPPPSTDNQGWPIRIFTGPHNYNYETCFPSGIDGREMSWKWSSLTRRLRRQWQIWLLCSELQDKPAQRPI